MDREPGEALHLVKLASDIVAAFVSNNSLAPAELPQLIERVHTTLVELNGHGSTENRPGLLPAVPIKKSVTEDHIICLEDGKRFKSLKRHLRTRYNLTPDQYREKWGLPHDYPMVAPSYARHRSNLARQMGLGQGRRED